jgi:serine/threonine protein phosphatase PrpC
LSIKSDKRLNNQDALYVNNTDKIWIVADGMGATVILEQQNHSELQLFWIGDCRAYLSSKSAITLLTKGHTLVQNLLELGLIDKTQALNHPKRHIVTQGIGGNSSAKP